MKTFIFESGDTYDNGKIQPLQRSSENEGYCISLHPQILPHLLNEKFKSVPRALAVYICMLRNRGLWGVSLALHLPVDKQHCIMADTWLSVIPPGNFLL